MSPVPPILYGCYWNRRRYGAGFSLVELLVVIGVVGVLTGLGLAVLRSPAGDVGSGSDRISGAMTLARTHAMANNTAAVVDFSSDGDDEQDLVVEVYGLIDPARDAEGSNLVPLARSMRLSGLRLVEAPGSGSGHSITVPGRVSFNSRGEAIPGTASSPHPRLEISLVAAKKQDNDSDFARVHVAGLTGRVEVERP